MRFPRCPFQRDYRIPLHSRLSVAARDRQNHTKTAFSQGRASYGCPCVRVNSPFSTHPFQPSCNRIRKTLGDFLMKKEPILRIKPQILGFANDRVNPPIEPEPTFYLTLAAELCPETKDILLPFDERLDRHRYLPRP